MSNIMDSKEIITTSLLEKNGFKMCIDRFEACECYHRKFKGKIDIDLTPNHETEWELIIMSNVSSEELVKFVSTVEELQKCLDIMGVELKIKQEKI